MLWKKACRRCSGDIYLQSDFHGEFLSCIQCGDLVDGSVPVPVGGTAQARKRPVARPKRSRGRGVAA